VSFLGGITHGIEVDVPSKTNDLPLLCVSSHPKETLKACNPLQEERGGTPAVYDSLLEGEDEPSPGGSEQVAKDCDVANVPLQSESLQRLPSSFRDGSMTLFSSLPFTNRSCQGPGKVCRSPRMNSGKSPDTTAKRDYPRWQCSRSVEIMDPSVRIAASPAQMLLPCCACGANLGHQADGQLHRLSGPTSRSATRIL
jgi:hypothetical protein